MAKGAAPRRVTTNGGEDDPWLIATDQKAGYLALRTCERRMWVEQLFTDFEGGGFHLSRSRPYQTDRLSRLVLALSWVYTWPGACGGLSNGVGVTRWTAPVAETEATGISGGDGYGDA